LEERRERTIAQLQEQFAQSHIDMKELSRRIELAEHAPAPGDLDGLLSDLPLLPGEAPPEKAIAPVRAPSPAPAPVAAPAPPPAPAVAAAGSPAAIAPAEVPVGGSRTFVAVFSGKTKGGRWYPPRRLNVASLFGGVELDLRRAEFQPGMTTIDVVALFGGVEIFIPQGMYADINGTGVFGGFDEHASSDGPPPQGGAPWLRIRGLAAFGGVDVKAADKTEDLARLRGPEPPALPPHRRRRRTRGGE
jgi:hypothetical protein